MRKLLLSFFFMCAAVSAGAETLPVSVSIPGAQVYATETQKYTDLGKAYRHKYLSTTLFRALLDVSRYETADKFITDMQAKSVLSLAPNSNVKITSQFSDIEKASVIGVRYSPPEITIHRPQHFYSALALTDTLMYFPARSKTGSWWAYVDMSKSVPWEAYFWVAYFIDHGFSAEISPELNMVILGNFQTAEEAFHLKTKFTDAPIDVSFVTFRKFNVTETSKSPKLLDIPASAPVQIVPSILPGGLVLEKVKR